MKKIFNNFFLFQSMKCIILLQLTGALHPVEKTFFRIGLKRQFG